MKPDEVFIHIGFPKTATTFLQDEIFKRLENVEYHKDINFYTDVDNSKKILFSNEDLSGNFLKENNNRDRFTVIKNLKHVFPHAKIIIGTRNKKPLIKSLYYESVRQGFSESYDVFLEKVDPNYTNFDYYIEYIKRLFDDVFVYSFEGIINNPSKEVKDICDFIGESVPKYRNKKYNISLSKNQVLLLRWVNKFFYHKYYNKRGIIPFNPISKMIVFFNNQQIKETGFKDVKNYWDARYRKKSSSGKGSVGKLGKWKWDVIDSFSNISDVVDVGCGDLSFWGGRDCGRYVGIDFSSYIIGKNRKNHPNWFFVKTSASTRLDISADVVLCLDLLFHIMDDDVYGRIIENLVSYARKYIFVYTWGKNPFLFRKTDGKYQKFRDFLDMIPLFEKNGFRLLATKRNKYLDKCGVMYIFGRG